MRRSGRESLISGFWIALALATAFGGAARAQDEETDPPEVAIGERLFLETRFAEFFARHASDVNAPLAAGDPVVEQIETTGTPLPGPFAGESINCRSCHFVDESLDVPGGGMRTYADFARRSPVPLREDGLTTAARNAPSLVNSALLDPDGILHLDGEFSNTESLVKGTFTGRNLGWLPGERAQAAAHVARVLREDDGSGDLAREFGGSYRDVFAGAPNVPDELRLTPAFRADVDAASDEELLDAVARLVAAYVNQLAFAQDEDGASIGSPYDRFLEQNGLPRQPRDGETPEAYTRRLRGKLERLKRPRFVNEGPFAFHPDQDFVFGPEELEGLRVFLAEPPRRGLRERDLQRGGVGNCVACHTPPDFTDFSFHNTGVTQTEYDGVHGEGGFERLWVPSLRVRSRSPNEFLPATESHPNAAEPYRRPASSENPDYTDLGVWNVFANADFPEPQLKLWRLLCREQIGNPAKRKRHVARSLRCTPEHLLQSSIARFKTPGLRDLGHSLPLMHDGQFDSVQEVLAFYRRVSRLARAGSLRNGDPEIAGIALSDRDVDALEAFLLSLNEDYE
jgi:cytochrome c peroxidase